MKLLFTFPGQGTQRSGMLQPFSDSATYRTAHRVLGDELQTLDSPEALRHTRAVQLALLIAGVAAAQRLEARGVIPDMVCGLSIGAYPAAVVAGALTLPDALRLVALRGELMEQAYPTGYGLTAIVGLRIEQVEALLADSGAAIANLNAETQIVIAGSDAAMAAVGRAALVKGASKVNRLDVSVPSHCALLNAPASRLAQAFADITLQRPRCGYLSGSSARLLWQPERIADDLAYNMARTVRWQEAMIAARERECRLAIEMPPGSVLTGLTQQAGWEGNCIALERSGPDVAVHLAQKLRTG